MVKIKNIRGQGHLRRYALSSIFFTIFGPSFLWLIYPIGPVISVIIVDIVVHSLRYKIFKYFVFGKSTVNPRSYLYYFFSLFLARIVLAAVINLLDIGRALGVPLIWFFSVMIGYCISRLLFHSSE